MTASSAYFEVSFSISSLEPLGLLRLRTPSPVASFKYIYRDQIETEALPNEDEGSLTF